MAQIPIGKRIRSLRVQRDETQVELAKRAGIHRLTLLHIENGKHKPDFSTVERLARALKTTVGYLIAA